MSDYGGTAQTLAFSVKSLSFRMKLNQTASKFLQSKNGAILDKPMLAVLIDPHRIFLINWSSSDCGVKIPLIIV